MALISFKDSDTHDLTEQAADVFKQIRGQSLDLFLCMHTPTREEARNSILALLHSLLNDGNLPDRWAARAREALGVYLQPLPPPSCEIVGNMQGPYELFDDVDDDYSSDSDSEEEEEQ
jgi:hypothetical protein